MPFEKERQFYDRNKADLKRRFKGRFVLIAGEKLIGDFETELAAFDHGVRHFGAGEFFIELVDDETRTLDMPLLQCAPAPRRRI
jgi:hypothetical protein